MIIIRNFFEFPCLLHKLPSILTALDYNCTAVKNEIKIIQTAAYIDERTIFSRKMNRMFWIKVGKSYDDYDHDYKIQ